MAYTLRQVLPLLTKQELELFEASRAAAVKELSARQLTAKITRARALRDKYNIAVVTNTIPNTGISLPFFSSGGTSLMMLLGEMGIVLSVSRGES